MPTVKNKIYKPDCSHNDVDIDAYYTRDAVFGAFSEDGREYVITRRDTPRAWLQYLCNDKVRSAVSNTGKGFLYHIGGATVTKHWEPDGNYLPRNVNGERRLFLETSEGKRYDFFHEASSFLCKVRPGSVSFVGEVEAVDITVTVFVPLKAPCEVWMIRMQNREALPKGFRLSASQDVFLTGDFEADTERGEFRTYAAHPALKDSRVQNSFRAGHVTALTHETYSETVNASYSPTFLRETLICEAVLSSEGAFDLCVLSSACRDGDEYEAVSRFLEPSAARAELRRIEERWDMLLKRNTCVLPDKNLERFLNVWLKNQLDLTFRYDRSYHLTGYRDGAQDAWGYLFSEPSAARRSILATLSHMHADGRCPRGFQKVGARHDLDDFCDGPVWVPILVNAYIKETGDYAVLEERIGFLEGNEETTVSEHIDRALDYMYHSRGRNGLILMRAGDWADGLTGIHKYGPDATSAWVTIAAYHAQNLMAELYRQVGRREAADELERRSAEYKRIVNEVAWDGSWLVYAFFEDGEPIGSSKNYEGKIWLNPQAWGIFSGIVDDKKRIKKMSDAVSRYLDTPYGAMVNYPPYVFYGERCGRIQGQQPGMFLNSAIYNHAASFKVFSDVKRGEYDVAYDTLMRCLPNHPDNADTRRTSEPYTVGNVYYGPDHPRYGMNLFSWFTAVPAWLIHGGFEELLGVSADFDGVKITPHVPEDWQEYRVTKQYRNTEYRIHFVRSEEKGIWVDGVRIDGSVVSSEGPVSEVEVRF